MLNSQTTGLTATAERPFTSLISRHACFLLLLAVTVAWFWWPLSTVVSLSLQYGRYEHYSHIVLVPAISFYLVFLNRRTIFSQVESAPGAGTLLIMTGIATRWMTTSLIGDDQISLSLAMLSMVTACLGTFLLCYGPLAFRKASFGLFLLLFMVPLPSLLLDLLIGLLQKTSAEATDLLFGLLGVPVFREGFLFVLPGLTIEVAESCSGIRSGLALLITGLVAGHLFLGSNWAKAALVVAVVPLTIIKNAIRIVVLSLLAIHVDPNFITGSVLHSYGGIPLFFVSLAALAGIIWLLQKSEARFGHREGVKGVRG